MLPVLCRVQIPSSSCLAKISKRASKLRGSNEPRRREETSPLMTFPKENQIDLFLAPERPSLYTYVLLRVSRVAFLLHTPSYEQYARGTSCDAGHTSINANPRLSAPHLGLARSQALLQNGVCQALGQETEVRPWNRQVACQGN